MRAGVDTLLARVVKVFGAVRPHHAYLFAQPAFDANEGAGLRRFGRMARRASSE